MPAGISKEHCAAPRYEFPVCLLLSFGCHDLANAALSRQRKKS